MRVVHISPTYFSDDSIVGGGERYPLQLATEMSKRVDTSLVTFSSKRTTRGVGKLRIETYVGRPLRQSIANPWSLRFLECVWRAELIHVHQYCTIVGDLSALACRFSHKPVFVTDHGGGGSLVLNRVLPILQWYTGAIAQSQYARGRLPGEIQRRASLISGGIDTTQFCPNAGVRVEKKILYVGRLTPHKGVNYLIEAFRQMGRRDYELIILGRVYDEDFAKHLRHLAFGLNVRFIENADDHELLYQYRSACVAVLPSVASDMNGNRTTVAELMGMAALEAQACGTPVVVTDAAALPEFVEHGRTGFVVAQNSPKELADGISNLLALAPDVYAQYQIRCRKWTEQFDWQIVVDSHLRLYAAALNPFRERREGCDDKAGSYV